MKTLLTAETTPQQLFDHVVSHLRGMEEQSNKGLGTACAYRGINGAKCAIGACIADEDYSEKMEGKCIEDVIDSFFPDAKHLRDLCDSLQVVHDSGSSWKSEGFIGEYKLKSIARNYGLKYTERTAQ